MGIDVYMRWKGMTEEESEAQYTGFNVFCGHVGYLREAYHGGPYATMVLVPEAFECCDWVALPSSTLISRLPMTEEAVRTRVKNIYRNTSEAATEKLVKSFRDFVDLARKKEAETGESIEVMASF